MTQTTTPDTESVTGHEAPASPNAAPGSDFRDAFRQLIETQDESPPEALNETQESTDPTSGNAADPGVNPDAAIDSDDEPRGSRRGGATQRKIEELSAQIEELRTKVAPSPPPSDPADDPVTKAEATIQQLKGSDEDWKDLQSRVVDGLSFEDAERFRRMQIARDFDADWGAVAEAKASKRTAESRSDFFGKSVLPAFQAVAQKPGIDPTVVMENPDLGKVFEHIYDGGRKDLADENEFLKGENKDLKRQLMGRAPQPAYGGRSAIGNPSDSNLGPGASTRDLFTAGVKQIIAAEKKDR